MFYIKKLIVTGDGKDASSVEFGPGLNIIHGPSNCGKSYIADCVDYMFGGKQMRIPADLGYDMITMIVSSEKGDITLRRSFDSNDIEVSSLDYRIDSSTYTAGKGSKKKGNCRGNSRSNKGSLQRNAAGYEGTGAGRQTSGTFQHKLRQRLRRWCA